MAEYSMSKELKRSAKRVELARSKADQAWEHHVILVRECHNHGISMSEIARLTGVTRARIWQIVHGGTNG